MKTLLIIGNDNVSSWLGARIQAEKITCVKIFIDRTNTVQRAARLLIQRRLKLRTAIKIYLAELKRQRKEFEANGIIYSNDDLVKIVKGMNPDKIVCFRCSLIISKKVIKLGVPIFNVHASDLPAFPGLGAIERSIKNGVLDQKACLHFIDTGIDTGNVLAKNKYSFKSSNSYKKNEDIAYQAAIDLVVDFLKGKAN